MRALAGLMENPALALDGSGRCLAELGGAVFAFSYDEERNCLFIQSHGGSLATAEKSEDALEAALQADYLWGGTAGAVIGLDGISDELGLAYRLDFPLTGGGEDFPEDLLCGLLPRLAGVTLWCRELVNPAEGERE
jgi:hypothetical protein